MKIIYSNNPFNTFRDLRERAPVIDLNNLPETKTDRTYKFTSPNGTEYAAYYHKNQLIVRPVWYVA